MRSGIAISLKYRHSHIEDGVLVYTSHICAIYLLAESEGIAPSFVRLQFDSARCVRSARTDCSPAIGIYPPESGVSFIVELTDSKWPIEAHEFYTYAGSILKPRGRHYVVSNHDLFYEILADSFSESLVEQDDADYDFIKKYFV